MGFGKIHWLFSSRITAIPWRNEPSTVVARRVIAVVTRGPCGKVGLVCLLLRVGRQAFLKLKCATSWSAGSTGIHHRAIGWSEDSGTHAVDGNSLVEVLKSADAEVERTKLYWRMGGKSSKAKWAAREGKWKMLGNPNENGATDGVMELAGKDKELFLVTLRMIQERRQTYVTKSRRLLSDS